MSIFGPESVTLAFRRKKHVRRFSYSLRIVKVAARHHGVLHLKHVEIKVEIKTFRGLEKAMC